MPDKTKREIEMRAYQDEVNKNYEAFKKKLPEILAEHRNKFALMKDGEIVGFYSTAEDAQTTAASFFGGKPFSIQKVSDVAIDLGFFSHAMPGR